jgi:putative FmdB family regulatory protein
MPLFEYRCNECKRKFSLLVGVTAKKEKQACPRCGSRKITKLISRISPVARGDDFDGDFGDSDLEDSDSDLGDDEDLGEDYGDDLD